MDSYGKLSEFHPEAESISAYLERVELFFTANSIADDKKVAVFVSVVGGKTYSLLRDLLAPEKPQDKSLTSVVPKAEGTLRTQAVSRVANVKNLPPHFEQLIPCA